MMNATTTPYNQDAPQKPDAKPLSLHRWVRRGALIIAAIILGYWMGYWHGRTYELYKASQCYGAIPETMTWEQFLERK